MLDPAVLKSFAFFENLSDAQLGTIAESGEVVQKSRGETLYRIDETADNLYGVMEGVVALTLSFEDKILQADIQHEEVNRSRIETIRRPIQIADAGPGKVFGWSALTGDRKRTISAACSRDCRLWQLAGESLLRRFEADPQLGMVMMSRLCGIIHRRLRQRTDKLVDAWVEAFGTDVM